MASNATKTPFPWLFDVDNRERECAIQLMVRNINGGAAEHWALYFEWSDGASATYEACNKDGYLIPIWNRGKPNASYTWRVAQTTERRYSPKEVNSRASQIALNGQLYFSTDRNSRHWASKLASTFGILINRPLGSNMQNSLTSARANVRSTRALPASGSQVSATARNGNGNSGEFDLETAAVVEGLAAFAGHALSALLSELTNDE